MIVIKSMSHPVTCGFKGRNIILLLHTKSMNLMFDLIESLCRTNTTSIEGLF